MRGGLEGWGVEPVGAEGFGEGGRGWFLGLRGLGDQWFGGLGV